MKNIYESKKYYQELKAYLLRKFESDEIEKVYALAPTKYDEVVKKYTIKSSKEKYHTNRLFPQIGMYKALNEVLSTSGTQEFENFIHEHALKVGTKLNSFVNFPNMNKIFLSVAKSKVKSKYGPDSGFTSTFVESEKGELKFAITKCPYLYYCEQEGIKDFVKAFCRCDEDCYGNLEKIQFIRERTLADGAGTCDFCFKVRDGIPKIDEPKIISGVTK